MITAKINRSGVSAKIKAAEEMIEEKFREKLEEVAAYLVSVSPVDTGAYVTSHSVVAKGSGAGRRRTSHGKPKNQNPSEKRSEALSQLLSDIASVDITSGNDVNFRNRAPHAKAVEFLYGYLPYSKTVDRFK